MDENVHVGSERDRVRTRIAKEHGPMDYVRSVNWERMHLNPSQRAALAVLMLPKAKEDAAQRMKAGKTLPSTEGRVKGESSEIVADVMKVSKAQVERAAEVQRKNPEAFQKIKDGKSTVRAEHAKRKRKTNRGHADTIPLPNYTDPTAYVISMNKIRRHLTVSQLADIGDKNRATIAANVPKPGRPSGKELRSDDLNLGNGDKKAPQSDAVVAKSVGVGEATVRRMAAVRKDEKSRSYFLRLKLDVIENS